MKANESSAIRWLCVRKWICRAVCLAMLAQIVLAVIWMAGNWNTVPSFGDTVEYIRLSETLALDEYRPILYPLLLRVARTFNEEHFFHYVYFIQTGLCLFCMSYAVFALDALTIERRRIWSAKNLLRWLFGGMYLTCIPMITFFNFTVLTDSIANSLLVFSLAISAQIIYGGQASVGKAIGLAVAVIGQCLIRADRRYSCIMLLVVLAIIAICRNPGRRRAMICGTACVVAVVMGMTGAVSSLTQVKGRNNRVQTDLSFVLLDRVVWPHMSENYEYFPQEIREAVTLEEAQEFDSHNNKVMYFMAPLLEERVGREKARQYYRVMARTVWERQSGAVLQDIGASIAIVLTMPFVHELVLDGRFTRSTAVAWNVKHCMSVTTPEYTVSYDRAGFYILLFTLAAGLLVYILDRIAGKRRRRGFILLPFVISGVLLCLWFTLGDGAPPNDRYMLIIYVTYALWPLTCLFGGTDRLRDGTEQREQNQTIQGRPDP